MNENTKPSPGDTRAALPPATCSACLVAGAQFEKDGARVDIDFLKNGEVYYRRWPKGVNEQGMFYRTGRMSEADFLKRVEAATFTLPNPQAEGRGSDATAPTENGGQP